jgi:ATP-dependent phosphoenolpyruvate carboxykinase
MASVLQTPKVTQLLGQEKVRRNLFPAPLVEAALRRGEAELAAHGSLVAGTGKRTGRSPQDKFTVQDAVTEGKVAWGSANQPFPPDKFDALYDRVLDYLKGREMSRTFFVAPIRCTPCPSRSSTNTPGTIFLSGNYLFVPPPKSSRPTSPNSPS